MPGNPPVAVVDLERNGKVVRACDAQVRAAGVHTGMSVNSALALVPALHAVARDARREKRTARSRGASQPALHAAREPRAARRRAARGAWQPAPVRRRAAAVPPARARNRRRPPAPRVRFAITPAPLASLWFARMHAGERPVLVRSREELASRIALAAARLHALARESAADARDDGRAHGRGMSAPAARRVRAPLRRGPARDARSRHGPAARNRARPSRRTRNSRCGATSSPRSTTPRGSASCSNRCSPSSAVSCASAAAACRRSRCSCAIARRPLTRVRLRFVQPIGAQPQRIGELLRERLARLELPEPVRNVRLVSGPLIDLQSDAAGALRPRPARVRRERAAARSSGCGRGSATKPCTASRAWPSTGPKPRGAQSSRSRHLFPRRWAEVARSAGDGAGRSGCSRCPSPATRAALEIEEGPECIETGWWDGHDVARDYYVARDRHGARCGCSAIVAGRATAAGSCTAGSPEHSTGARCTPNCTVFPTSRSCVAPHAPRNWSSARHSWGTRPSRSPTNAPWPASSVRTWRQGPRSQADRRRGVPARGWLALRAARAGPRGYGRLCRLITRGRRAAPKGEYRLCRDDFVEILAGARSQA